MGPGRASFSAGTPDSSYSEDQGSFRLHNSKRKASAPVSAKSFNTSGKIN